MKLRTRLIVAFLLLSVVPLGAVTIYSYRSNVRALESDGAHQADLLAGELTERMQLVTSRLSERVQQLMDIPQQAPATMTRVVQTAKPPAPAAPTTPAPAPAAPSAAEAEATRLGGQVADALGEAAILLNTVELPDLRWTGMTATGVGGQMRQTRPPGAPTGPVMPATPATRTAAGGEGKRGSPMPAPGAPPVQAPGTPPAPPGVNASELMPPGRDNQQHFRPAPQRGEGGRSFGSGGERRGGGGANAGAAASGGTSGANADTRTATVATPGQAIVTMPGMSGDSGTPGDRIKIDLNPIRRDIYRQILPSGRGETLTAEERQRVVREVNQRMLGIVEGIKLSAAELQKRAEATRAKSSDVDAKSTQKEKAAEVAATTAAAAAKSASAVAVEPKKPAPPPATPPPAAPPAPATAPAKPAPVEAQPESNAPLTRRAALSGDRLDVTIERNGQIVRSANAEINLPNVLMTVFSSTRHEQGEVPFAVAKDGRLYAPSDDDRAKIESLGAVAKPDGPLGSTVLPEWIVVTTQDPTGSGLRFGIARPVGDSLAALRQTAGRNAAFGLLFIGAAIAGIVPLSSRLTRNLTSLTGGVTRIAQGDYGARVTVTARDEFGELAGAFNRMAEQVEEHQRSIAGQERIKRELELGRQIQHDMLPQTPLKFGLTEIQGVSVPAREVGGDFFNYFALPSGHVALLVGDVSGKGVGAALLMANIQASLRTRFALGQDLSAIANAIDLDIEANSPGPMYATLFLGILDPATRELRYVNAGHNPQFVLRRQGGLEKMSSTGLPVGLLAGRGYNEVTMPLAAGDMVFFYTDGCVETENETGEMFGADRLEPLLVSVHATGADNVLQHVERALEQFRGARELYDDATMMAVRIG